MAEPDRGAVLAEQVAVDAAQRRARDHRGDARVLLLAHPVADEAQPRPAVLVGERDTAVHLLDVGLGMERVTLGEQPVHAHGDALGHCRLARSGDAHADDDVGFLPRPGGLHASHPSHLRSRRIPADCSPFRALSHRGRTSKVLRSYAGPVSPSAGIPADAVAFYAELEANNTKWSREGMTDEVRQAYADWWTANKERYEQSVREPFAALTDALADEFGEARIFRPYRDVRFSADKTPYKTEQGAIASAPGGAGYYVRLGSDGLV